VSREDAVAKLDRFFKAMFDRGASELRLVSGQSPTLVLEQGVMPASSAQPSQDQLMALLKEVLGALAHSRLENGHPIEERIDRPGLPPMIAQGRSMSGSLKISFRPAPEDAPPPEEPEQEIEIEVEATSLDAPAPAPAPTPPEPQAAEPAPVAPEPAAPEPDPPPERAPAPQPGPTAQSSSPAPASSRPRVATASGLPPAIDDLFRKMVEAGASDMHLSSDEAPILRIDGDVTRIEGQPARSGDELRQLLYPILPEKNREEFDQIHDTDFAYELPGVARFRANIFMDRKGPGAVFRTIPTDILTAEDLGLSPKILELCQLSKGLVLVTGPTGSGKSTTLTALIDHINKTRSDHIITIEDPIEFVHDNHRCLINQREVGTHTGSFKRALRAALREDPDIVLVGEMRDLETIAIAIETAETGHLVFGTLHTTTAVSTVDRIIDQFPPDQQAQVRTMLSESLKGVIAQTLCKKKGGGRVAALEVLIGIPSVANLIREGKTFQIPSIMQTGKQHGMICLNEALMSLVEGGKVEASEAVAKAADKAALSAMLRRAGYEVTAPDAKQPQPAQQKQAVPTG
jgi:twitching motility protein PilT